MSHFVAHYLAKPATVGAVRAAVTYFQYPRDYVMPLGGKNIPLPLVLGGALAIGSIVGEAIHTGAFPLLPPTNRLSAPMAALVTAGASAGTAALLLQMSNGSNLSELGLPSLLLTVGLAEAVGDYVYSNVIAPVVLGDIPHHI